MAYTAQDLIRLLSLQPHPEGGWYAFRGGSGVSIPVPGFDGERETCSYIYYLLQKGEISRWHRLLAAEVWTWHQGGSLLMTLGGGGGAPSAGETLPLGPRQQRGLTKQANRKNKGAAGGMSVCGSRSYTTEVGVRLRSQII